MYLINKYVPDWISKGRGYLHTLCAPVRDYWHTPPEIEPMKARVCANCSFLVSAHTLIELRNLEVKASRVCDNRSWSKKLECAAKFVPIWAAEKKYMCIKVFAIYQYHKQMGSANKKCNFPYSAKKIV